MSDADQLIAYHESVRLSAANDAKKKKFADAKSNLSETFWKAGIEGASSLVMHKTAQKTVKPLIAAFNFARGIIKAFGQFDSEEALTSVKPAPVTGTSGSSSSHPHVMGLQTTGPSITAIN